MINNNQDIHIFPLILCMLYVTFKLLSNALFMNHISINLHFTTLHITQSAMTYGFVFIILDAIFYICGKKIAIIIIFLGMLMDALYSYGVYSTHFFTAPEGLTLHQNILTISIKQLSVPTWSLYYNGLVASIITYLAELFIFSFVINRIFKNQFFLSSILSVGITLFTHNLYLYYKMFGQYDDFHEILISNYLFDMTFIIIYSLLVSISLFLNRIKNKTS